MNLGNILILILVNVVTVSLVSGTIELDVPNTALDHKLYEDVLDPELCHEQVRLIRSNTFLSLFFADAGPRIPRGILQGNNIDVGNYHQCIGFNQPLPNYVLQGKYCMIRVPIDQNFHWPDWGSSDLQNLEPSVLGLGNDTFKTWGDFYDMKRGIMESTGILVDDRTLPNSPLSGLELRMAMCIPKPCTTQQAITSYLFNVSQIGFTYTEQFCRLAGDKPWSPGVYVAVVIFSLLGLITVISTGYDVWHSLILKTDPKSISVLGRSFSVYTNGRRLMTFSSGSDTIDCVDGIRAFAMAWVIVGHTFGTEPFNVNLVDAFSWLFSWKSLWISGGHMTVDTFFVLSGFLVVYTTLGKLSGTRLMKNIHLFYLNRLLRMFPLLAATVLFEATFLNHFTDAPLWSVTHQVEKCRKYWWMTLLHIQNYFHPMDTCIPQSWYLAIDVQLHILSPIVLFWVLNGKKKTAWSALLSSLCAVIVASTVYNFYMEFPSTTHSPTRANETMYYHQWYYRNTLARASPFFIGLIFGYLVRTVKVKMTQIQAVCYWVFIFAISSFTMYLNYPITKSDWDNQTLDSLYNSFVRPVWSLAIGLIIYACVHGYGGPINWFLSLDAWKLPARLSYGMYLNHYALMFAINASLAVSPPHFSVATLTFKSLAYYALSFILSFFMTLIIDSPFSVIFKILLGGGAKKPPKKELEANASKNGDKEV